MPKYSMSYIARGDIMFPSKQNEIGFRTNYKTSSYSFFNLHGLHFAISIRKLKKIIAITQVMFLLKSSEQQWIYQKYFATDFQLHVLQMWES